MTFGWARRRLNLEGRLKDHSGWTWGDAREGTGSPSVRARWSVAPSLNHSNLGGVAVSDLLELAVAAHGGLAHIGFVAEDLYRTFYGDAAAGIAAWMESAAGREGSP
jgi:hypothetical protein